LAKETYDFKEPTNRRHPILGYLPCNRQFGSKSAARRLEFKKNGLFGGLCIYLLIYINMYIYIYMCEYIHEYIPTYVYVYIFVQIHVYTYVHIYVCTYMYVYIYIFIYIYIHYRATGSSKGIEHHNSLQLTATRCNSLQHNTVVG